MSFLIRSSPVTFANITTQPTKPAAESSVQFIKPIGLPIREASKDLIKSEELINGDVVTVDKNSSFESNFSAIEKSYAFKIADNYDPSSLAHAFPRFKAYENLTGLTTTRPEIIMTMTFKPLFTDQKREDNVSQETGEFKNFTNEGNLIDAQIQMLNLKYEAFVKLLTEMKQDPEAQKLLVDAEDQFILHIDKISAQVNFIRGIVLTLENLKQFLNIRNSRSKIDFSTIIYNYFKTISSDLKGEITTRFESSTSYSKILSDCGFTENNIKNFSNTKIYLQSLYELKKLLIGASDELTGIDGSQKMNDSDPTSIIKTKIVDVNREIAQITNFTNDELKKMQDSTFRGIASKISTAFKHLDSIQAATPDDRTALLYHVVSKEYSYSYALADNSFVRFIEQSYGYRASQTNNLQMFDTFVGHPGNRIVDRVYALSPNSSMGVAQQDKGDFIVLPFEGDYIDYDSSIFSPGPTYYIDESLKVSTSGLDLKNPNELRLIAENQTKFQSTLFKYLIPRLQNTFNNDTAFGEKISNSSKFFDVCISSFLDPATRNLKSALTKSNLGVVFDKASSDSYLKALLFMYFHIRTLGIANDDAFQLSSNGMIESIAAEISKRLKTSTPSASKISFKSFVGSEGSVSTKIAASVETELKDKSEFTKLFSTLLGTIYNSFSISKCFNGNVTRYAGIQNSALFLTVFEMLFSTFIRLNEKKAISFTSAIISPSVSTATRENNLFQLKTQTSFEKVRTAFYESVNNKLKFENDLILKMMFTHLNTFDSLQNALRNSIVSLQKDENVKTLNDILKVVESNEQLGLLINGPQINIIKNAIDDINSKFSARLRENYKRDTDRIDVAATYLKSSQNDIVLFDDFLVSGPIKQMLYEYFSTEKYSINRAFNSRILSVGIPQGFEKFLKEKVALSNITNRTLGEKEVDIIKVNVYKVDVRYQNLIFKPQSFIFELSRFVSKDYSSYLPVKEGASEKQITDSIPFRDYSVISDLNQTNATTFGKDSALYLSSEYDFLTNDQKDELMRNHIRSHMLELYVKLMSGFSLNEMDFLVDESASKIGSMSPIVVDKLIKNVAQFRRLEKPKAKFTRIKSNSSSFKKSENATKVVVEASKTRSLYSDGLVEARKIMKPKIFDRIFNIFVDPDDFEIDQQETIQTDSGKEMLESLFSSGKVIEIQEQSILRSVNVNFMSRLKLMDKNPKENDVLFEKYFVTLETVLGELA